MSSARKVCLGLAGLLGFALLLEVAPRIGVVPERYAPPTSRIITTLAEQMAEQQFWLAVLDTVRTWLLGLAIAVALGVVLGVLIGTLPVVRAATSSTIEFLRPIPSVALIPLVVVLYGSTIASTLVLVVYAAFWQVLVQVLHGVADIDPVARDTAHSYRLGRWNRVRYLVWPTALPYVATGVRLAATVALILTITGELVIGSPGLGREIATARSSGAVAIMYALIVVTGLFGVVANLVTRAARAARAALAPVDADGDTGMTVRGNGGRAATSRSWSSGSARDRAAGRAGRRVVGGERRQHGLLLPAAAEDRRGVPGHLVRPAHDRRRAAQPRAARHRLRRRARARHRARHADRLEPPAARARRAGAGVPARGAAAGAGADPRADRRHRRTR